MSQDKYFIAWHPEYGYDVDTLSAKRANVEARLSENDGRLIKPVHLIDDAKVREMWGKILALPIADHITKSIWRTSVIDILQSILPEPKD